MRVVDEVQPDLAGRVHDDTRCSKVVRLSNYFLIPGTEIGFLTGCTESVSSALGRAMVSANWLFSLSSQVPSNLLGECRCGR